MKLNFVRNNVIRFLKNLFYSFEALAEEKNISLQFVCDEKKVMLDYEPDKLEKIIVNLLSNAFKFTPTDGSIIITVITKKSTHTISKASSLQTVSDVTVLHENDFVTITIADTGVGIAADRLPHVFDRFYQVDSADTQKRGGSGIGLALAKELVQLHNGILGVTSEVGKGTEFIVQLPRRQIEDQLQENEEMTSADRALINDAQASRFLLPLPGDEQSVTITRKPTESDQDIILIVEDNADVRHYIRDHLQLAYHVWEAVDGEQGLLAAQETIPDLIISDVMMPNMDGYEFCKKIRADEKTSHIPIIMLTAKAGDEEKITGLKIGVDDYLIKPFNADELVIRIENLIKMRKKLREKFSTATIIRPSEVSVVSADQAFLKRTLETIDTQMSNEEFNVTKLAAEVHMSEAQLNRKLQALINQPPGQLIRSMRLQRAADLLSQGAGNITEICYHVGFSDLNNFARSFKKQFGVAPSTYKRPPAK